MTDDLVQRLRSNRPIPTLPHEAADRIEEMDRHLILSGKVSKALSERIEQLEREKAVVSDLWEQQKEIALDYLADCNKAADRIEVLEAEIERLRAEADAQYDRGYYEGCANPIVRHDVLREALEAAPIITLWERKEDFRRRQDGWLKTKYRAALDRSK